MDASISTTDSSSSHIINEKMGSDTKRRSSDPSTSLTSSLASASPSSDRRCISEGRRGVKTTTFDKVFIFEFSITIGNNPAVREGCPVSLGSECIHTTVLDLESYEHSRRPSSHKRRRGKDLYIPVYDRATLLMSQGFTLEKIVETVLEVEAIKKSRQESMKLNGWQKLNYAFDIAGKSIMRRLTNGNGGKTKWSNEKSSTSDLRSGTENLKSDRDQKRENVVQVARMA